MKFVLKIAASLCLVAATVPIAVFVKNLLNRDPEVSVPDVKPSPELVARGEYLTRVADCQACHQEKGGEPFTGGRAFQLPFGTLYSTNITPDLETGIGTWSDDDFVRALHRGIRPNGENLYPAFPYTSYTALSREDAVAIKSYLFTLKPVRAPARKNELSFPFNQRWSIALWNGVFLADRRFQPDPAVPAAVNRGDYIANALGHCGECHTPRTLAFSLSDRVYAGAHLAGWNAYNITSHNEFGIGAWSDEELRRYLLQGHAPGRGTATGPMGEVVEYSLQHLEEDDASALISYLRTVPPRSEGFVANAKEDSIMTAASGSLPVATDVIEPGQRVFERSCASCHAWNGDGLQQQTAALKGLRTIYDPSAANLLQVILHGTEPSTLPGRSAPMPPFASLSGGEIADLVNFIRSYVGSSGNQIVAKDVADARQYKH
ncbi:mono/diheme cytochrome c family protein [Agrobacterium tumefaciens]|uniref:c-type cytochrome n=1 Tax=Agrobacterium radiobacter TaxID=362 RepID=UPI0016057AD1|nr:cytochrome c [Agrobacterium radiobacter]MBB4503829.1 mono/diheme cytochrome c family protein [Agrobacterium radiobacter]